MSGCPADRDSGPEPAGPTADTDVGAAEDRTAPDRVALDASALMAPVQADVRLFEELDRLIGDYEPVVPRAVLAELDRLADGGGEASTAAAVGRDLATRCTVVDAGADNGDDALVALAPDVAYVVTNDRPLRDRVGAATRTIGLRGRAELTIH
jgi:rRNA-processing protein FCF1